ncbi:MAG: polyphenol oxidase family protein [Oscillospiraceae bacterium]|jgi:YfiH family protein|nr:polyphenol oxidase family protein [Oscillospiraceae bacterium]
MGGKITRFFSEKLPRDSRERFHALDSLGFTPVFTLRQEHGDTVVRLRKPYRFPGIDALIASQPRGDSVVTDQPGLYVGVKTADCVPILLWDEEAGVVAAAHAGWRGTAKNIAGKTIAIMRDEFGAKNISAAIGPCICAHCFETDEDVPDVMPPEAFDFITGISPGRFTVDLPGINAALLRQAGVAGVALPPACTACNPEVYWSHRKHKNDRGLQVSLIGIS